MTLKPLFFIAILLLITTASAVSISPVRFNESVSAGGTASFTVTVSNSTIGENSIESPEITGDCAGWITVKGEGNDLPVTRTFTVNVPATATNGAHRCDIAFMFPETGMVRAAIGFPVSVMVSGGIEPTPATTTTTPATTTSTPATTTSAPVPTTTTSAPAPEPGGALMIILMAGLLVVLAFIAVMIYDIRRERR